MLGLSSLELGVMVKGNINSLIYLGRWHLRDM